MSIADPFTVIDVNETSSKSDSDLAPHYAMKIALQTLRDRCTKLQTRISRLEEENLHLRIVRGTEHNSIKENNIQNLNHIDKDTVLIENDQGVWTKLPLNGKEKSQLKALLPSYRTSDEFSLPNPMSSSALKNDDIKIKEDSLEEISLRGGIYGRTGHSSKDKNEDCDLNEDAEYGNLESLDLALKDILKKMKRDQEILRQQQEGLKSALGIFKKVVKENSVCKTCLKREESAKGRENKIVGTEESLVGRNDTEGYRCIRERIRVPIPPSDEGLPLKDRICPLCEKYFHCSTPFDTFNEHVLSHFVEEDDEEKVSSNHEVVT